MVPLVPSVLVVPSVAAIPLLGRNYRLRPLLRPCAGDRWLCPSVGIRDGDGFLDSAGRCHIAVILCMLVRKKNLLGGIRTHSLALSYSELQHPYRGTRTRCCLAVAGRTEGEEDEAYDFPTCIVLSRRVFEFDEVRWIRTR